MKYGTAFFVLQLMGLLATPSLIAADKRDIVALPADRGDRAPAGQPVWSDGAQSIERTVSEGPSWYRDPKALSPADQKKPEAPLRGETVDEMAPALRKNPYVK